MLLWYYLRIFKSFQDDYGTVSIPSVWSEYVTDAQKFDAAKLLLESVVRSEDIDDQIDNRILILDETVRICDLIAPIVSKAEMARTELNKLLEEKQKKEKQERESAKIQIWILIATIASLVVAIFSITVTLLMK
ncbi:MAG: hypothetical protein HQM03_07800 [Magnetococcales bacterium]|nr:hypothetical protein [Magnetococcales bacterium]